MENLISAERAPQTMEFTVNESFAKQLPAILSNVEELKAWAEIQTEVDKSLALRTDDDFAKAKDRCAQLNKVLESLDTKRKSIKKQYMEPFDTFERSLREVHTIVSAAKDNLWNQIKEAEAQEKREKQYRLQCYYEDAAGQEIVRYRPFVKIFDKTWLNKGKKFETVCAEMDGLILGFRKEIDAIRSLKSENEQYLMLEFARGMPLSEIIGIDRKLAEEKQIKNNLAENRNVNKSELNTPAQEEKTDYENYTIPEEAEERTYEIVFKVTGTRAEMQKLKSFLNDNHYKYERA